MATTSTQEITIPAMVFTEVTGLLRSVIGGIATRCTAETRRAGGTEYAFQARLASVGFWLSALSEADLDRRQRSELSDLDASFARVAALAGCRPGGDVREVLSTLSDGARRWSISVWRQSLPVDQNAEFERRLHARIEAEELERTLAVLEAQEAESTSRPQRISTLQDEARRLREVAEGRAT